MFSSTQELEEYIEGQVRDTIEGLDHLNSALDLVGFDYTFDYLKVVADPSFENIETALSKAESMIDRFADFVDNWQEKAVELAEEDYKENYSEEFDSFEEFMKSEAGQSALQIADEDIRMLFDEDEELQAVDKMFSNLGKDIDDRNVRGVVRRAEEFIDSEFSLLKETTEDLPYEIIKEAFDD
jgi:hypothetical protein